MLVWQCKKDAIIFGVRFFPPTLLLDFFLWSYLKNHYLIGGIATGNQSTPYHLCEYKILTTNLIVDGVELTWLHFFLLMSEVSNSTNNSVLIGIIKWHDNHTESHKKLTTQPLYFLFTFTSLSISGFLPLGLFTFE